MSIEFDCSEIEDNIRALLILFDSQLNDWALSECHGLERKMKLEAKWENRTHEARKRLSASYKNENGIITITLAHGVDYGVFLELAHKKSGEEFAPFAIIGPVVRSEAPKAMASCSTKVRDIMKELL